jgi:hypothetical protein
LTSTSETTTSTTDTDPAEVSTGSTTTSGDGTSDEDVAEEPMDLGGAGGAAPIEEMMGGAGDDGMLASGGAGGMAEPPDEGEGSEAALGCTGSELLCEDFETAAIDGVPGDPWVPLDSSCEFQLERFRMGVSDELAYGGSQSLKITNKHDPNCRFSGAFDAPDEFWVRAFLYWETAIELDNRETLAIDLTPGYRTADDPAVRFGYRSKAPCEDFAGPQVTIIGIGGGEATGCGSRPLPQGEWYCFEAHVQQADVLEVSTFINEEAISYQSIGKEQTASIQTESPIGEKIDHIRLGIFSTSTAEGSVYVDDVAVSASRLGCPAR